MNPSDFDLNSGNGQFDTLVSAALETGTGDARQTAASLLPGLNLSSIKAMSGPISKVNDNEFTVKLNNRNISASQLVRRIQSSNNDIYDVVYSEEMEDNDLINVTDKPLWAVSKLGDTLSIKRVMK